MKHRTWRTKTLTVSDVLAFNDIGQEVGGDSFYLPRIPQVHIALLEVRIATKELVIVEVHCSVSPQAFIKVDSRDAVAHACAQVQVHIEIYQDVPVIGDPLVISHFSDIVEAAFISAEGLHEASGAEEDAIEVGAEDQVDDSHGEADDGVEAYADGVVDPRHDTPLERGQKQQPCISQEDLPLLVRNGAAVVAPDLPGDLIVHPEDRHRHQQPTQQKN
eukprot:CAMPEP_0170543708 /NCGR_PEP_ID=MMETSP0211-20121228/2734_1 /TAXON_ID=311385 /ORGANISM="Pseudokeronopsis sp., Strain OXSARD2" /LENGTH=217 /DNA_ID=CAMNT_0010847155 /DNA_START=281 /DNA_END=937 /DNA_ORIENTATION=+